MEIAGLLIFIEIDRQILGVKQPVEGFGDECQVIENFYSQFEGLFPEPANSFLIPG